MNQRRSRSSPRFFCINETLESRIVLSGINSAAALHQTAIDVAAQTAKKEATKTTLTISAGTLDQPITFTVTVRSAAAAGPPQGMVNIIDHGKAIQTLTLSPAESTSGKYAFSEAIGTLTPQPGGSAYFFGKHSVSAAFVPGGSFSKSTVSKTFNVSKPAYTVLTGGVKIATVARGAGPEIQSGQTASVFYTGYLASNGHIFDDSINDGGSPFSFTLGAGDVIPGFDLGTIGMQVGETRIVLIPPAEGYGHMATGPIPGNSTLIFVLTLESIS